MSPDEAAEWAARYISEYLDNGGHLGEWAERLAHDRTEITVSDDGFALISEPQFDRWLHINLLARGWGTG